MEKIRILLSFTVLVLVLILSGCYSSNPADIAAFAKPYQVIVTTNDYIIQPPDVIELHCSKVPEIHLQRHKIRPDGKVAFEILGEFQAAGKTPKELSDEIHKKVLTLYALTNENPVETRVLIYQSSFYYVLGEVYLPGAKPYTGRDSVLKALAEAKIAPTAWKERVQVIRPSADPNNEPPKIFELNYDKLVAHGDTSQNVLLQEGDVVYVPPTVLAAAAMVVEEVARPIGRAFSTVNVVQQVQYTPDRY